ncbi:hypothetical protein L7F22_044610 [Adiantum nelumboides]|nr:hypothetical protein [Adiantum nelumboides]
MVQLFWFIRTRDPNTQIEINGETMSQDHYVYSKVLEILPPQRVKFLGKPIPRLAFVPTDHWVLDIRENSPFFRSFGTGKRLSKEIPLVNNSVYTEIQEKKLLLKQAQPSTFNGEGAKVEQDAESWVEAMFDYFAAAGTTPNNQAMLARFRLIGGAKLWWKQWCKDEGVDEGTQTWENIKKAVEGRYLPPGHKAIKMNEFFALKQFSLTLEEYYSKFVTLRRYAPALTSEEQIARFCQGLVAPWNTRLEAMRPSSLQDALIRAKPLVKELNLTPVKRNLYPNNQQSQGKRIRPDNYSSYVNPRVYNANGNRPQQRGCFDCGKVGHFQRDCPRNVRPRQIPQAGRGRVMQVGRREGYNNNYANQGANNQVNQGCNATSSDGTKPDLEIATIEAYNEGIAAEQAIPSAVSGEGGGGGAAMSATSGGNDVFNISDLVRGATDLN